MCGIFALINNRSTFNANIVNNCFMLGKERGPEDTEYKRIGYNVYFGFHRLAINGLNSISNQPLCIDNVTLICNGEIYNYKELYSLINVTPETNSDCEIIIHLYKRFGIEYMLTLLDGYFSFILMDESNINEEPVIYVARDPHGVRPLYLYSTTMNDAHNPENKLNKNDFELTNDNIIGFASELKSLSGFLTKSNKKLAYVETTHNDIFYMKKDTNENANNFSEFNIIQYPPGTYSKLCKPNMINASYSFDIYCKRYTEFPFVSHITPHINNTECKYIMEFDENSPETINVFKTVYDSFSNAVQKRVVGTTDRPVACLLSGGLDSSLVAALVAKNYSRQLETFSIGMPGGEDFKYARMVADHIGSNHTEIIIQEDDFFNAIPHVIKMIESYDTTTVRASVGNYLVAKYISEKSNAKVIFNGDGSDELTGGYLYFHHAPDALSFDKEIKRLLTDIYLFDVLRSDKSISSNGLEPRTPFLDRGFVQTYLSLPLKYRYTPGKPEKWLLRRSIEQFDPTLLPKEVLWRTKEAFSDGVSAHSRSWYEIITEKVNNIDYNLRSYSNDAHLCPMTTEQRYYRSIFDECYPYCEKLVPYFWMPKFINANDASARTLNIYKTCNANM
jgi:asparagine synthase (glutamine-hydrolysing)